MEINKIHDIDIYINEQKADIFSTDKLNLRFNNTFADPAKISTNNTEYSFSFNLPVTRQNEKIFDFANILSKRNKFNKRYKTHVNVDGILIFDGELILTNISDEGYKCNLYINRLNTVEKIFGDSVLSDITDWKIDYTQQETINAMNEIAYPQYPDNDVFFPLVSYGMFQKTPTVNETYTSKFLIDDYAIIYNENFYPSLNLLKTVKKCFEHKGYTVDGDIFDDDVLRRIYMSTSLSSEQDPLYNYGKEDMGKFEMSFDFTNYLNETVGGRTSYYSATSIEKSLDEPKFFLGASTDGIKYYNWEKINIYDIWSTESKLLTNVNITKPNNIIWRQNRLVAPCDGYYKIRLKLPYSIDQSYQFVRYTYGRTDRNRPIERQEIPTGGTWTWNDFSTEFQLVKNSEDGTDVVMITPDAVDMVDGSNYNKYSAYPHEKPSSYSLSTESDPYPYGYIPQMGKTLNYDPRCNPNFVMGCCTSGAYRYSSVIKNGRSWDSACDDAVSSRYDSQPYYGIKVEMNNQQSSGGTRRPTWKAVPELTSGEKTYGVNTLPNSVITAIYSDVYATFDIEAIVHLKKNDYLQLKMVTRQWLNKTNVDSGDDRTGGRVDSSRYRGADQTDARIILTGATISFECFSPDDIPVNSSYMDWNNPSRFSTQLDLAQFLSDEEKMSDFINNFIKEFNLSYSQNGKNITLNKQKITLDRKNAINLTDRLSENEVEMEYIDFPSQMSVQYTINEEERGFYISAERNATDEQIQSNNWKDYADRGYDIIQVTEDEYADESKVTTKTSYNWYEQFTIQQQGQNAKVDIPIIAKDEWMIDGYRDAEMMKEDGLSLKRRYWFPGKLTDSYLILNSDPNRKVKIRLCTNEYDGCDLSYKLPEAVWNQNLGQSLLTRYFNVFFDASTNYVQFEAYLTTDEYVNLKNGANIIIDDDVYIVTEIQGYDCSGNNKTEIRAIKK